MDAGLAQKQIGEKAGISQPTVSRLSSGISQEPSYSEGEALRALFAQTYPGQPIPELTTPTNSTPETPEALAHPAQGAMCFVAESA
jgi:transcriptional regulator with XRE-family HTH domain